MLKIINKLHYAKQIQRLTDSNLGSGWLDLNTIIRALKNNQILAFLDNDKILGYLYFYFEAESCFMRDNLVEGYNNSPHNALIIKTIIVAHKKLGIGSKLISKVQEIAQEEKIKILLTPVWKTKEFCNAEPLFKKFNFEKMAEQENFWMDESLNKKNFCIYCDKICNCSNLIYRKNLLKVTPE